MRTVAQPGEGPPDRIRWAEARGRGLAFEIAPGRTLLDGVREGLAAEGFTGGALALEGGAFGPLTYVMPALSPSPSHAAFYSEVHRPSGASRIVAGAVTFGRRGDGGPLLHCHALWVEADGRRLGGHVLADETVVAEPLRVRGVGLHGAAFVAEADPETNFTLLAPAPKRPSTVEDAVGRDSRVFALRLRPNQDIALALERFCRERGIRGAVLHGGVGSLIGARFADGRRVEPFVTEVALREGRLVPTAEDGPRAELDVVLIDCEGEPAEGRLVRGDNPVLMTFEIVVEPRSILPGNVEE